MHHELRHTGPRVIERAEGVHLWDAEGHRLIDGMAGLWCAQIGFGSERLVARAERAMRKLSYYNAFFQTTNPEVATLSQKLSDLTPGPINNFFFASSGSEANDSAIKLIWYYWNLKGRPKKKAIISRASAYHGSTIAAASLTGLPFMHSIFDLPLDGIHHVAPAPHFFKHGHSGESEAEFASRCAQALEDKIVELGPDTVAAFVGEPIMGAGGVIIPPEGYWQQVQAICRKYDILLWSDEVICGFGRTGAWFGCQTYGYTPDIITMAKGITSGYVPLSAVGVSDDVSSVLVEAETEMAHGFTYSGHPVCCAVALENIAIMEELDLVGQRGAHTGADFQHKLASLRDHPLVGEVRTKGLLGAVELSGGAVSTAGLEPGLAGQTCRDVCYRNGVVMRAVGDTMILSPPLIISEQEIDDLVARIAVSLTQTQDLLFG